MEKMPSALQNRGMKRRTRLVAAFFAVVCFGTLVLRLWNIQITDYDFYAGRASGQQLRDSVVHAPRGDILDCKGRPLAVSATCWSIRAIPREMAEEHVAPAAAELAHILELPEQELLQKLGDRKSNDKLIVRRVSREKADAVRAACAQNGWQGIILHEDTKRWYPEGDFAASLLGFTNVDNAGLSGLELRYNDQLTGTDGRVLSAKNAWGYDMPNDYDTFVPPVQGNTLELTVDREIQHFLENHLEFAVKEFNVSARAVGIVMEVDTGRILAISTKPDYDPNEPRVLVDEEKRAYVNSLSGEERSKALQTAQQEQWRNKAVSDLYEPGSVFKLITCAAALDAGAVSESSSFYCGDACRVAGIAFHCANHKRHGAQSLAQALANSCNQSFIQIGQKLGKESFCDYFEAFGLRGATGIDLPAEPRRSEFYTADKMGPVELASCSFGQSSKITPIQMITAVSAIVNGGRLMQPYVVEKIVNADGKLVEETKPKVRRQVISEQTSAAMRGMMEGVVDGGTGRNGYVAGFRVGGKTGTSQKLDSEDEHARIASFVGVAPIEDPKIAVLIALDEPHAFSNGGGALAAPVAARVIEDTLDYYGIPRQYQEKDLPKKFAPVPGVKGWSAEGAGRVLTEQGFAAKIMGQGDKVIRQIPEKDTVLPRGSTVLVYMEEMAEEVTTVPLVEGMGLEQAVSVFNRAGLNLKAEGAIQCPDAVAVVQSAPAGEILAQGSGVNVQFWDPTVPPDLDD